ncbi:hypothetical protein PGB90_008982 [Kerria lacca]
MINTGFLFLFPRFNSFYTPSSLSLLLQISVERISSLIKEKQQTRNLDHNENLTLMFFIINVNYSNLFPKENR